MNDEIMTLDKMLSEASKTVPTARSMDMYMNMLSESIDSAVVAMENGQDSTAAMYIGQANMIMKHMNGIWSVIMQRNG
jgi:hypothetical protein